MSLLTGSADDGQDARADRFGERVPGSDDFREIVREFGVGTSWVFAWHHCWHLAFRLSP